MKFKKTGKFTNVHRREPTKAEIRSTRLRLLALGMGLWSCLVVTRLWSLQISDFDTWEQWASKQHEDELTVASERGPIVDREGRILAISVPAGSIYVRPHQIKDLNFATKRLSEIVGMSEEEIESKLASKAPFVWLARQQPRLVSARVEAEKLAGVGVVAEAKRYYPFGESASTLIGRVGTDGQGLSGIEMMAEKSLTTLQAKTSLVRDALGNRIQKDGTEAQLFDVPKGDTVQLTLDAALQRIVDEELENGRIAAGAKGGMATLIDAQTGEVLAVSHAPLINFNVPQERSALSLSNVTIESAFEPGSVVKPLVAAAALDVGAISTSELFDVRRGSLTVSRHTIRDVHYGTLMNVHDVVVHSSNIGMSRIGLRMGADRLHDALANFGLGHGTVLGMPGEGAGILRPVAHWAAVDTVTHSFGHGFAVTQIQAVRALSSLANGGYLPAIQVRPGEALTENGALPKTLRVLSPGTATLVRKMLIDAVELKEGTGNKARIPGLVVGGKTGTAQVPDKVHGGYKEGAYIASFAGFVDARQSGLPRILTLMVSIEEPSGDSIYGGAVAAPIFQRIMNRSFQYLGARLDAPELMPPGNIATSDEVQLARIKAAAASGKQQRRLRA